MGVRKARLQLGCSGEASCSLLQARGAVDGDAKLPEHEPQVRTGGRKLERTPVGLASLLETQPASKQGAEIEQRIDIPLAPNPVCTDGRCRAYRPMCRPERFSGTR